LAQVQRYASEFRKTAVLLLDEGSKGLPVATVNPIAEA
jgi:hypothetical protein